MNSMKSLFGNEKGNRSSHSSGSDSPTAEYTGPMVDHDHFEGGNAGYFTSVFNLMNGILGCGIVGLPVIVNSIGSVGFTFSLLFVAVFGLWTIDLLLQICVKYRTTVYEDLATKAFGRPGRIYTSFVIGLSCFIAQGAFLYIVKDNIVGILQGLFKTPEMTEATTPWYLFEDNSWILTLIVIWGIVAPLTLPREINFLGKSSGVAMIGMMIFAAMLIVLKQQIEYPIHKTDLAADFLFTYNQEKDYLLKKECCNMNEKAVGCVDNVTVCRWVEGTQKFAMKMNYDFDFQKANISSPRPRDILNLDDRFVQHDMNDKVILFNLSNIWSQFPTMIFAFQCHASALPIYTEQKVPTRSNFLKVAITAIIAVFLVYWTSAMAAVYTFYNATWNQVMLPYIAMRQSDIFILIARITIVNCVTLSAPLLLYTGRKTLVMLFSRPNSIYLKEIASKENYIKKHIGWALVNLIAVSILVCTIKDVGIIFQIGGAVTANSIVVILPTAFYYKLMVLQDPDEAEYEEKLKSGVISEKSVKEGIYRYTQYIYPFVTGAGLTLMVVMLYDIFQNVIRG